MVLVVRPDRHADPLAEDANDLATMEQGVGELRRVDIGLEVHEVRLGGSRPVSENAETLGEHAPSDLVVVTPFGDS